jgi:PAS domain S-box-containing protein
LEPDYLIVLDPAGNIAKVNKSFERALNRTRAEMYGQGLSHLVMSDDLAVFIRSFSEFVPVNPEPFRLLHKNTGVVTCKLIRWRARHKRSYIVLRRVTQGG